VRIIRRIDHLDFETIEDLQEFMARGDDERYNKPLNVETFPSAEGGVMYRLWTVDEFEDKNGEG
jgi:hypothetical protein